MGANLKVICAQMTVVVVVFNKFTIKGSHLAWQKSLTDADDVSHLYIPCRSEFV